MIDIEIVNKTKSFKSIRIGKSQIELYKENKAHLDILKLVKLDNKSFGERIQKIVIEYFNMYKSTDTSYDAKKDNIKYEIKSSRFLATKKDLCLQHIMETHDYDYLLLCGINYNSIDVYIISKDNFMYLKNKNLVKKQGGAEGQGLLCDFNSIREYLTLITNENELKDFVL